MENTDIILEIVGDVPERFLQEAEEKWQPERSNRVSLFVRYALVAAFLLIVVIAGVIRSNRTDGPTYAFKTSAYLTTEKTEETSASVFEETETSVE